MAKTTSKKSADRKKRTGTKSEKKTTTLSIRLTDREKELLSTAAGAHALSPTQFIKRAALTRAAQWHNAERDTSFDFDSLADRIVELLLADFPKEALARLTPKGMKQLTAPANDQPKLPPDGEGHYEAVVRAEADGYDAAELFEPNPDVPLRVWLPIDEIPPERRSDNWKPGDAPEAAPVVRDGRRKFYSHDFQLFLRALHLGGSGFVEYIISSAEPYLDDNFDPDNTGQSSLEPIDPETFGELRNMV